MKKAETVALISKNDIWPVIHLHINIVCAQEEGSAMI